jgi:hypothetical protein
MNLLQRLALVDLELPPTPDYPDEYTVNGILPMLWLWVRHIFDCAINDWQTTVIIIRQDHPKINKFLRGDVWGQPR